MIKSSEHRELKFERTIPALPSAVFDAWLDSKVPGTPFHEHDKLIVDAKVDGLWYWLYKGNAHYGRYLEIERPGRIRKSWMSRHTLGEESTVTVTFQKKGDATLLTLVHSGLPNDDSVKAHDKGWNILLGNFVTIFGSEAHPKK